MMLKKLRFRFIRAALSAFILVTLAIVVTINLVNYCSISSSQDEMLSGIYEYHNLYNGSDLPKPPIAGHSWATGSESDFTTRFFVVQCTKEGQIELFNDDHVSSIDETTAQEYVKTVLDTGNDTGTYSSYRYRIYQMDDYLLIIFLNVENDIRFIRMLLIISVAVAAVAILIVSLLLYFFSNRAIRPYVKNAESQKRFITDISHELKTPLTSIITNADIAEMEFGENEWITGIQNQAEKMTHMINDMIALSKAEEGLPALSFSKFSISSSARQITDTFQSRSLSENKPLNCRIEDDIMITAEKTSVETVLNTLLDNAFKYSTEGSPVQFRLFGRHRSCVIEVENSVFTDLPEDLDQLFDRFYKTDTSRTSSSGSFGIGLSIAKAAVENNKGSITAVRNSDNIIFRIIFHI